MYFLKFATLFLESLFFLPIWFNNSFGLEWISAAKEPFKPLKTPLSFAFKTSYSLGFLLTIFIASKVAISLFKKSRMHRKIKYSILLMDDFRLPVALGLCNMLVFCGLQLTILISKYF